MLWTPRLGFGASSSSAHTSVRENAELLRSFLDAAPDFHDFKWSNDARDAIYKRVYATFWGAHSHCFINEPLPNGVLLSAHQSSTDPHFGSDIPGMPCGHIFRKGDCCYKCKDCALDDSCVLCSRCFNGSEHDGHNVSFYLAIQPGGCCDCGDPEAWKQDYGCAFHPRGVEPRRAELMIPPELHESMTRTIDCVIDFILDTLDNSPEETVPPKDEADLKRLLQAQTREKQLATVLWNDEKHSFTEVTNALCELIQCTPQEGLKIAELIDSEGRAVIFTSEDLSRTLKIAKHLSNVDLGVTVRRARDTFREQTTAILIEWLVDLIRSYIYGNDGMTVRELVAARLFDRRNKDPALAIHNRLSPVNPSKLEWLFFYHTRLWKRPRFRLKDLYITILSLSHEHKIAMAVRFANVYNRLMDSYLLVDREAENSVKYFALQLFTAPTIAQHLVKNNRIIERLHKLIIAFFTDQIHNRMIEPNPRTDLTLVNVDSFPFKSKRFMPMFSDLRYICSNASVQALIVANDEHLEAFLRTCRLFMGVNPNRRMASQHVEFEQEAWISVFNVTLSLSRVVKVYAEAYGDGRATPKMLCHAIDRVGNDIVKTCRREQPALDRTKYDDISYHPVSLGHLEQNRIIDFDVLSGWVSFHHSEHWLLAELLKHVDLLTSDALGPLGYEGLQDFMTKSFTEEQLQIIIEFPLRVLAMIAQIRTGLWVRNGFAIRGQLLHYRDYMLRELCYDQDLFILQSSLVILTPNLVFITMLDRFRLLDWHGGVLEAPYEGNHLVSMIEEFLYTIITILSERAAATQLPLDAVVRREAIHGLALGPCSYSDLCKRVAERIMDEASFDRALQTIAHFRPPEGVSDVGMYELKDELYDEVEPFFFHYTRNRREEVESILKARITKKTGNKTPVIVPKPLNITTGPFSKLTEVFKCEALFLIITIGLWYTSGNVDHSMLNVTQSTDAIVDQYMHLLMLALVEQPEAFSELAAGMDIKETQHQTLIQILCLMETSDKSASAKPKVQWCLNAIENYQPAAVQKHRTIQPKQDQDSAKNDLDAKKRAAKARQAAIMKQFAAQQKSFLESVEDEDMDEDDDTAIEEDMHDPTKDLGSCIVCQENLDTTRSFGALGLVQASRFRRQTPSGSTSCVNEFLKLPPNLDDVILPPPAPQYVRPSDSFNGFPPDSTEFGLHTSFCGHFMHVECFKVYTFSVEQRHLQQTQRNHAENIERDEFVCPLCKSLGNVILPVFDAQTHERPKSTPPNQTLSEWARVVDMDLLRSPEDRHLHSRLSTDGSGEFTFWSSEDSRYGNVAPVDDVHKMIQTLKTAAESISQQSFHLHGRLPPSEGHPGGGLYLPRDLVAYTISCLEIGQRGVPRTGGSSVAENISESSMHTIRSLLASLRKFAALQFPERPDGGRSAIRQAIIKRMLPQWTRDPLRLPLLFRDPLTILVEVATAAPDILRHATTLMHYACLARTCLALLSILGDLPPNPISSPDANIPYDKIFGDIRIFVMSVTRHSPELERFAAQILRTHGDKFEALVYSYSLPFLRQAAILTRAVTASPLHHPTSTAPDATEYERLLDILQIPPLSQLPNHESLQTVLAGWSSTYGVLHSLAVIDCTIGMEIPGPYQLAQLPRALDALFTNPNALVCHRCRTVPTDAAICMFCGTVCCYQMHCCIDEGQRDQGECNMHTRSCGGVIGLFYCIKRCSMLFLYAGNGSVGPPPYLDIHGEVDTAMRRGRRQYLHPRRLEELRKMWLNHGIPTYIARKLDAVVDAGGWDSI